MIAIVGEAWGEQEERQQTPFVGPAGYELTRMLAEAGIHRADCHLTNVFNLRPERNDIESLCTKEKSAGIPGLPAIRAGLYIRAEYRPELDRLYSELSDLRPNVTVVMGNTAAWAILHNSGIAKARGTITASVNPVGLKVLPTYHPAYILRNWSDRHVTILDLMKAKRESAYPEIILPQRTVIIEPDLSDLDWFYATHILGCQALSVDIETAGDQITCIGFAPSVDIAFVVPFTDPRRPNGSYWPTPEAELVALTWVRKVLTDSTPKLFQNGLYDMHFLWRRYGIQTNNAAHDTMLLHHALQPESEKGLGFLGSVYTNEASWKLMRTQTIKRDE